MFSRFVSTILILFAVFAGTRAMVRALPGDPIDTLLAESGTSVPREELRHEMGLDLAFFPAVIRDARNALHGDFGRSLFSKQSIAPLIGARFLNTLWLSCVALSIALGLSLLIGLHAAAFPGELRIAFAPFLAQSLRHFRRHGSDRC